MTTNPKEKAVVRSAVCSSKRVKNPSIKAYSIWSIREIIPNGTYQTKGMACAVNVQGSVRFITWHGVIGLNDRENKPVLIMDRYCSKFPDHIKDHRLELSISSINDKGIGISYLPVDGGEDEVKSKMEGCEIPDLIEPINQASDFVAYSFSGKEQLSLKFKYNESEKKHEYLDGTEYPILEESSVIGSPIIVEKKKKKHVVGVVGIESGKLCPCFVTKEDLDQSLKEKAPSSSSAKLVTAGENDSDSLKKDELPSETDVTDTAGGNFKARGGNEPSTDDKPAAQGNSPVEGVDGSDSANQKNGGQTPSASDGMNATPSGGRESVQESTEKGSVQESIEKVRSDKIPVDYLPYLAEDVLAAGADNWKSVGRKLNLSAAQLNSIQSDNVEVYERCYKMFIAWSQKSSSASYEDLAEALKKLDLRSIRENYCLEGHDPLRKNYEEISNPKMEVVSDKDLQIIAAEVEEKHKRLGRALGIKDDRLDRIVRENTSISEQSYQILQKWKQEKGRDATYNALGQALLDRTVNMRSVMAKFCQRN